MEALTSKQLTALLGPESSFDRNEEKPRMKSIAAAILRMNFEDKVWLIFNEFGLLSVAVGRSECEALDNAVNCGAMDSCLVPFDELDADQLDQLENGDGVDDLTHLGNASELFDLSYISMREFSKC